MKHIASNTVKIDFYNKMKKMCSLYGCFFNLFCGN